MKAARIVVLGIAVAAGGLAAILAGNYESAPPPPAPAPAPQIATSEILVAKNDLNMGVALSGQDIEWQKWPESAAANPAFIRKSERPDALQQFAGAIVRVPMAAGEPVRENKLIRGKGSGYMAAILPSGMRAYSTEISAETGAGGFILPNDRVTTKSPPLCQASIEFKKFGVSMNFTPVVMSEGRISLKVMTEVSDLSSDNALSLTVPGATQNVTIPSIRVRRADTTVEIPSGGSLAMAGMIQEQTKQAINGIPGLQQLPVLGALFRSRDYVNNQTELMILVTPFIVHAVAQKDLSRPDDGYADVSDPAQILLGRLNKIYGVGNRADPNRTYNGRFGFIMD